VSIEARKWAWAFERLGLDVRWIAGDGDGLDVVVRGLSLDATAPVSADEVRAAVDGCDVVVVENLLSLPLNVAALRAVAEALRGRPTIVHHHDLPWQRERFAGAPPPPADVAWRHVTINRLNARELRARAGIDAVTIYNHFERPAVSGERPAFAFDRPLLLHPTRAIPRKNVPAAIRLAEAVGGTYWLLGPPEDGYEAELESLLRSTEVPVLRGGGSIGDAYDQCDLVVYPSTWEGFGNPTIESALVRKPLAVGSYPVLDELRAFGFRWFDAERDVDEIRRFLADPDVGLLDANESIAREHFALERLPDALRPVLEQVL